MHVSCSCIYFFKQKTAYEMRISDWSSDVCSSDLDLVLVETLRPQRLERPELVERMERGALLVLLKRVFLGRGVGVGGAHNARHRLGLGHALLLGEQFEGAEAPPAGGHLEPIGSDHVCTPVNNTQLV